MKLELELRDWVEDEIAVLALKHIEAALRVALCRGELPGGLYGGYAECLADALRRKANELEAKPT